MGNGILTWSSQTIKLFLEFTLGMWSEICDALHGATEKETKHKIKNELVQQVRKCFSAQDMYCEEYQYLFDENVDDLCARSIQYLIKWLVTVDLVDKRRGEDM